MRSFLLALLLVAGVGAAHAERAAPLLLALDFELIDTSGEPVDKSAEHARRLRLARDWIADALAARGVFAKADIALVREKLDDILARQYLRACNGCELDLARAAGAEFVLLGRFHKVSTLVGSLELIVKNAKTGEIAQARALDFRGDDDRAWLRAAKFYVDEMTRERAPDAASAR